MAKKLDGRQFRRGPAPSLQMRESMSTYFRPERIKELIQKAEVERLLAMRKERLANG